MELTICKKCENHTWYEEYLGNGYDIDYELCKEFPVKPIIDPVTGKNTNQYPYKFCEEINKKGNCPDYKEKIKIEKKSIFTKYVLKFLHFIGLTNLSDDKIKK